MGVLVSFLNSTSENQPDDTVPSTSAPVAGPQSSPTMHLDLPPPMFGPLSATNPSPTPRFDDPFPSPLQSPAAELYFTAPSTPITSPSVEAPPPTAPAQVIDSESVSFPALHITIPDKPLYSTEHVNNELIIEEAFPTAAIPIDMALDDEGLNALEKIYLFARSEQSYHREYIVHALPSFLELVTPQEAVEYVLPLLSYLAVDQGKQFTFAALATYSST